MFSEPRKEALRLAKVFPGWWQCAHCKQPTQDKQVDHIVRVGKTPKLGSPDWGPWLARMFIPHTGLQILCVTCHNRKTEAENDAARHEGQKSLFEP
jgi:5-methylcytosine-specific restriction endonuclease McrA